jgi:hypothetical protein
MKRRIKSICSALYRAHRYVIGIGWTDLGCSFALSVCGQLALDAGRPLLGVWCSMLAVVVYFKAPRKNNFAAPGSAVLKGEGLHRAEAGGGE